MRNKLFLSFLLTVITVLSSGLQAQKSEVSAGILIGGLTGSYGISDNADVRADLDFLLIDTNAIYLSVYYVSYINSSKYDIESGNLRPYFAPGIQFSANDGAGDPSFGLIVPIGIEYALEDAPVEVFFDSGPYLTVEPNQILGLSGSIGFRYRF